MSRPESSLWIRKSFISLLSGQFHATRQNEQKHWKVFFGLELKNGTKLKKNQVPLSLRAVLSISLGSALIWKKIKQLMVCSKHQNTWEDTGNVVKVFFSIESKRKNERQWNETEISTPLVVKDATSLLLNSFKFNWKALTFFCRGIRGF